MPTSASMINALRSSYLLVAFVTLGGCTSATSSHELTLPETIRADDKVWSLEQRSAEQDQRVLAYFRKNPSLADHPGFGGQEACYADAHGNLKYYWVSAVGNSRQWISLEYRGSRAIELLEGEGEPFLQPSG